MAPPKPAHVLIEAIRRLYTYDSQATTRVLDTAAKLSNRDFVARVVEGQRSVRDTLVHMVDTQICHLSWVDGSMTREDSFARQFPPEDYPDVAAVRRFAEHAAERTRDYLATLVDDVDPARVLPRSTQPGGPAGRYVWEVLLHVANHATQHRSEVAVMLTALRQSPGDLDLL
jgi:uncharacterized damage-inducible protein DinB